MPNFPSPAVIRHGAIKSYPFTILVVANPALERPWNSGTFVADPITGNPAAFNACVNFVNVSLFGGLPHQAESLLGDPAIAPQVRLISLFQPGLPPSDAFSFVAEDGGNTSDLLIARRNSIRQFLTDEGLFADVVYAVSASPNRHRASAWFTTDDDTRPGVPFLLDAVTRFHRLWYTTPGTVALPANSTSITALHEFQHAISSYSNGMIVDQYVDCSVGVNVKTPQPVPVPPIFGYYTKPVVPVPAGQLPADPDRLPIGYPPGWQTYHCNRHDRANPAVMDDYWQAPGGVAAVCQNDLVSRQFVMDRVRAKLTRP